MRILNLSLGQDTGGQQMRLAQAWRKYRPEDEYTSVTTTPTFYEIENRLDKSRLTRDWWPNADVVHLNNDLNYVQRVRGWDRRIPDKPLVIHHHGTMFRTRPEYHLEALHRYGATAICSTVDLHAIAPAETVWLPQAYDLEELQGYRERALAEDQKLGRDPSILRIAHAPTNRPIKSTEALVEAVNRLRRVGVKVELDIIEGVKNRQCLERKARADVFVDQLLLGYGCNAIEAFGMGIPVIAGVDPEQTERLIRQKIPASTPELMLSIWGSFPFYSSTETDLFHALAMMLKPAIREQYSVLGMDHFMRFHHAPVVVQQLAQIYESA